MPTQTFFNLPEEKRSKIIECAIDEFSSHPFQAASLSRIVEEAGISKGSMYQYFADKKDVYLYLLDVAGERKVSYMNGIMDPADDYFTNLYKLIVASNKFSFDHPRLSQLVSNMMSGGNDPFPDELFTHLRKAGEAWVKQSLIQAQAKGEVRADLDLDFLSYFVTRLTIDFGNYLIEKNQLSYGQVVAGNRIPEGIMEEAAEHFIMVLREGIGVAGK